MIVHRTLNLIDFIVISTTLTCVLSQQPSNRLHRIVIGLKHLHSQTCQYKFENCIQDSSYADQLDNDCSIYSRIRDCYRPLLDDAQCLSSQLKHQYTKAKQNEYAACGPKSSYESVRSLCLIHKFRIREKTSEQTAANDLKSYECLCIGSQNLNTRKPITQIKAVKVPFHRLLAVSDNILQALDSDNLQPISNIKVKPVVAFCVSSSAEQHQSGSIDICVSTKRNKVQVYRLDKTNITPMHEISVQDLLISMAMDSHGIIGCSETEYFSYDPSTNNDRRSGASFKSILKLDDPNTTTCFTNISPGEYLLNGPNFGVTTSLQGTSERAPIVFASPPSNFIYSNPYVLVLVKDYIQIYSYLDNQLKQDIPLKYCRNLLIMQQDDIRNIVVASRDNIYLLVPLSLEEQIDQLLNSYRLQEALTLAESTCSSVKQRSINKLVILTKKRIGFIEFGAMNVARALNLFDDISLNFSEIAAQIPNFLPLNSSWPSIDESIRSQYLQWLNALCDYMTNKSVIFSREPDYYATLLKAYLFIKPREFIVEFVQTNSQWIPVDYDTILIGAQCYHATAILYSKYEKHQQAIDVWKKLVSNEYSNDDTFPGVWIIPKYVLERNLDRPLEFSIAVWLLERNEEDLALKIFTNKHKTESNSDPFSSNRVVNQIKAHPTALVTYLEHAVFKLKLETDTIHTMLVNIYLDQTLSKSDDGANEEIRSKLQTFIIMSNSYRVQTVFSRVSQTSRLQRELALLYGKMNNFEQAFRILVDQLHDFEYAEKYCIILSCGKSVDDRKIVAHVLFKVFLSSLDKYPNEIKAALLRLLSSNEVEFDFIEVLQRLPSHWSIAVLSSILARALRSYSYAQRSAKLESALIRVQNERLHLKLSQLKCLFTVVNEQNKCQHCQQQFYDTSCVVYQDNSQVHVHCAKKYNQNREQ